MSSYCAANMAVKVVLDAKQVDCSCLTNSGSTPKQVIRQGTFVTRRVLPLRPTIQQRVVPGVQERGSITFFVKTPGIGTPGTTGLHILSDK